MENWKNISNNTIGKISSQIIFIKKSYRFRGKQLRIHRTKKTINPPKRKFPKNKKEVNEENKIIKEYSPKKRRVKGKEEYSVLNPLTNSDSPSVKSKGARLVSANRIIIQQGRKKNPPSQYSLKEKESLVFLKENLKNILNLAKKKNDITTS